METTYYLVEARQVIDVVKEQFNAVREGCPPTLFAAVKLTGKTLLYGGVVVCSIRLAVGLSKQNRFIRDLLWSRLQSYFRRPLNDGVRASVQKTLDISVLGVRQGHPHGESATNRNSATVSMTTLARNLGFRPYVISPSMREQEQKGCRYYYQLNDFAQDLKNDPVTDRDAFILTDIDYYLDWSDWLQYERPALFYTFVPDSVGGDISDGAFSIKGDHVEYMVSGGGVYKHQLWNYSRDSLWVPTDGNRWWLRIISYLGRFLGLWNHIRVVMFSVDQFQIGPNRRIISLVPFATLPQLLWNDEDTKLQRHKFSTGQGFNIMRYLTDKGQMISVGAQGQSASATLLYETFVGVSNRFHNSTSKTLSDVQRYVGDSLRVAQASILYSYLKEHNKHEYDTITSAGSPAKHYMCIGPNTLEDGKKYARKYAPGPLTLEAVYPLDHCENNEIVCIQKRVDYPQWLAKTSMATSNPRGKGETPPARFNEYAQEFVDFVVKDFEGLGNPIDISDVIEKQDLPKQRTRSNRRLLDVGEKFVVGAFQKKEAYTVANDPRNISSVPTMHTLKLSSFTLAFKEDCLKRFRWYTPGATPSEISARIMALSSENEVLAEGDFSRFDGSITKWIRVNVEFACYQRWVDFKFSKELTDLLFAELNSKAYTKLDMKYTPGCSRLSGSPLTTDGNTLINAFVAYATLREKKIDKEWAFHNSGLYYGDDSLMSGKVIHVEKGLSEMTRVAATVGLQLKVVERAIHTPVSFLSRVFPDPWTSPDSMADPQRALAKIHTTINSVDEIELCGFNKANAYLVTDSKTPLVSHWCRAYLKALGKQFDTELKDQDLPYWYVVPEYRTEPWPQQSIQNRTDLIAKALDLAEDEIIAFCKVLDDYSGPIDSMPRLEVPELEVKVKSAVGCEIRSPGDLAICSTNASTSSTSNTVSTISERKNGRKTSFRRDEYQTSAPSGPGPANIDGHSQCSSRTLQAAVSSGSSSIEELSRNICSNLDTNGPCEEQLRNSVQQSIVQETNGRQTTNRGAQAPRESFGGQSQRGSPRQGQHGRGNASQRFNRQDGFRDNTRGPQLQNAGRTTNSRRGSGRGSFQTRSELRDGRGGECHRGGQRGHSNRFATCPSQPQGETTSAH